MRRTVAEHQQAVRTLLGAAWAGKFDDGGRVPLIEALGRVAAQHVDAGIDLPPFANSQMDGFAVSAADLAARARLKIAAAIPAGSVPAALQRGFAAPIMTGAMLPDGADAVVPVERADPPVFPAPPVSAPPVSAPAGPPPHPTSSGPRPYSTTTSPPAQSMVTLPATETGTFVRHAGSDIRRGGRVITAGTRLTARHLGVAAGLGLTELAVRRRPRVLLAATGDEVVLPGSVGPGGGLPAGKIFDANSMLLHACLLEAGAEVVTAGLVPDDPQTLLRILRGHVAGGRIDAIVTTGGISAGAYEVVKQALSGEDIDFLSVAMQPGGPQALGTFDGVPFLGFPGNPVSGVVSFEMFLRPALTELTGSPQPRPRVTAVLTEALTSPAGKHQIRRAVFEPAGAPAGATVRPEGGPSSHLIGALADSNALIQVPADVTALAVGAEVEVWLL
ncbi:gephyrin-like molybdotransferase Glp [Paenarthrobacter sp. PH39-S1]|uniref:molybdopterin molybdotransferase MoeA n=1 Tax=Paenarthrobacter sp. PH39-S1 TaxID=3046204 RepID=UPI0024B994D0|nr:gephyrin-like molybdotransferase Glp [Paenarthrobacter sp. PH39-S1]MDJ0357297.1 molybdopterin molybdotransferase MoeA [Paenarthrobacter sp. PH39-S1]